LSLVVDEKQDIPTGARQRVMLCVGVRRYIDEPTIWCMPNSMVGGEQVAWSAKGFDKAMVKRPAELRPSAILSDFLSGVLKTL
jgi:hypothetical protein